MGVILHKYLSYLPTLFQLPAVYFTFSLSFTNVLLEISPIWVHQQPLTTHTMESPALPTADGAEAEDDQRFGGRKGALECARNDRAAGASAGS